MKYIPHHLDPLCPLDLRLPFSCRFVLVIPSFQEGLNPYQVLDTVPEATAPVLSILVINQPCEANLTVQKQNQITAKEAQNRFGAPIHQGLTQNKKYPREKCDTQIYIHKKGLLILLQVEFATNAGVGRARKLGLDLAHLMFEQKQIESRWLHTTDADVKLPNDYLIASNVVPSSVESYLYKIDGSEKSEAVVALTYPFEHTVEEHTSILAYDRYLRHYVSGLRHAKSPFSFFAIGSILALDSSAYAAVRGVPLLEAGEDFYLLNKLRKHGAILELDSSPIQISGRASNRTPFGTGRSVEKLNEDSSILFDDRLFEILRFIQDRIFYTPMENLLKEETWKPRQAEMEQLYFTNNQTKSFKEDLFEKSIHHIMIRLGLEKAIQHAETSGKRSRKHLIHWWDGLKVLRCLHLLSHKYLTRSVV